MSEYHHAEAQRRREGDFIIEKPLAALRRCVVNIDLQSTAFDLQLVTRNKNER